MNVLVSLITGGLAGWLAGQIMQGRGLGLGGSIGVGVVGAFLANNIFRMFGLAVAEGFKGSLMTALVGACGLLFLVGIFKR
jgi:uncharacterized membrane protein YeaQ/YmgE (transglycosylase-associated protein family)